MPEPWATILSLIVGPYGVVVAEALVIYFLWRLFREATAEIKRSQDSVGNLTSAVRDLTSESKTFRETLLARLGD